MFTKFSNKVKSLTIKQWIAVSLWIATLVLLVVFVILAATLTKDEVVIDGWTSITSESYANITAGVGLAFTVMLIAALLTTVWFAYTSKKSKAGK